MLTTPVTIMRQQREKSRHTIGTSFPVCTETFPVSPQLNSTKQKCCRIIQMFQKLRTETKLLRFATKHTSGRFSEKSELISHRKVSPHLSAIWIFTPL